MIATYGIQPCAGIKKRSYNHYRTYETLRWSTLFLAIPIVFIRQGGRGNAIKKEVKWNWPRTKSLSRMFDRSVALRRQTEEDRNMKLIVG